MRLIGIDENGYGPVLGPLVVTSTSLKLQNRSLAPVPDLWKLLGIKKDPHSNSNELLVCDSKTVFNASRKKELAAEATVLAFFYLSFGFLPESADQFLNVVIDPSTTTYNPFCFCWKNDLSLQLNAERRKNIRKTADRLRKRTDKSGVVLEKPRCFLFCPFRFNEGLKSRNKSDLVIESGLSLIRRCVKDGQFHACLGKVGGLRYYREPISALFGPQCTVTPTREEKNNSAYQLSRANKTAGTITYLRDGEDNSFLIALASLFGKYTRELFWKKTRTYLEELLPSPPPQAPPFQSFGKGTRPRQRGDSRYHASGYRDPLTRRFIRETEGLRKKLNIPDDCFLRRK
ncbi:MAG: hypothetical protein ABII89_00280 [Candidatus Omnitrophota bacterium]